MKSSQRESWPGILQRCWKKNLEIFNDGLNIAVRKVLLVKKKEKKSQLLVMIFIEPIV